jgi:hypothetical protein
MVLRTLLHIILVFFEPSGFYYGSAHCTSFFLLAPYWTAGVCQVLKE